MEDSDAIIRQWVHWSSFGCVTQCIQHSIKAFVISSYAYTSVSVVIELQTNLFHLLLLTTFGRLASSRKLMDGKMVAGSDYTEFVDCFDRNIDLHRSYRHQMIEIFLRLFKKLLQFFILDALAQKNKIFFQTCIIRSMTTQTNTKAMITSVLQFPLYCSIIGAEYKK